MSTHIKCDDCEKRKKLTNFPFSLVVRERNGKTKKLFSHHQICCKVIFLSTEIRKTLYTAINQYASKRNVRDFIFNSDDTWHEFIAVDGVIFYIDCAPRNRRTTAMDFFFIKVRFRQKWKLLHSSWGRIPDMLQMSNVQWTSETIINY